MTEIKKTNYKGLHVFYIDVQERDVFSDFKKIFQDLESGEISNWKLVGHHDIPETAGPENTWIIPPPLYRVKNAVMFLSKQLKRNVGILSVLGAVFLRAESR